MKTVRNCEHCNKEHCDGPYVKNKICYNYNLCRDCYRKWTSEESLCEIIVEKLTDNIKCRELLPEPQTIEGEVK